jgi:hypothetical protein
MDTSSNCVDIIFDWKSELTGKNYGENFSLSVPPPSPIKKRMTEGLNKVIA